MKYNNDLFQPGLAVVCVILGFHDGVLKVLLNSNTEFDFWRLPGSFILKEENIDEAAHRILYEQTGLEKIFLCQFNTFGDSKRIRKWKIDSTPSESENKHSLQITDRLPDTEENKSHWNTERIVSIGYYALIEFSKVKLIPDRESQPVEWKDINSETINYFSDHRLIINNAIDIIRTQLAMLPIGKELLPDKFTMSELRAMYEAILGRTLDRRNFQRKVLSLGYIDKLNEHRKGGAHKAPVLFRLNVKKYEETQEKGLGISW